MVTADGTHVGTIGVVRLHSQRGPQAIQGGRDAKPRCTDVEKPARVDRQTCGRAEATRTLARETRTGVVKSPVEPQLTQHCSGSGCTDERAKWRGDLSEDCEPTALRRWSTTGAADGAARQGPATAIRQEAGLTGAMHRRPFGEAWMWLPRMPSTDGLRTRHGLWERSLARARAEI